MCVNHLQRIMMGEAEGVRSNFNYDMCLSSLHTMEEYSSHVKFITIDIEWGLQYYDRILEKGIITCEPSTRFVVKSERKLDDQMVKIRTLMKTIVCEDILDDSNARHMREMCTYMNELVLEILATGEDECEGFY